MSCSTLPSLASNKFICIFHSVNDLQAYFISEYERFTRLFWSLQYQSRAWLVRHSLYKLKRIGDKQHSCLTPHPIYTLLASPRFIHTLTRWAMHKLLINLLSRQSIPVPFRIWTNLVQLTRSKDICTSANTQFCIYLQGSFRYYSQHSNCIPSSFSTSKSELIFSKYILKSLLSTLVLSLLYVR